MSTRNAADDEFTQAVIRSFDGAESERARELLTGLVRHVHAFAREVGLTEDEWRAGIDFLTRTGHITDERRQEFVLLSDVLGLSMLTIGLHRGDAPGATESTVFGPFFVEGSPAVARGGDLSAGAPGERCAVAARVTDTRGEPIAGARVEVWQADEEGFYDVQRDGLDHPQGRGHLETGEDGRLWFWTVKPEAYPIPADGPVGELL